MDKPVKARRRAGASLAAAIVLAVLALNFVGDGLRDALDVRLKMD